MKVVAAAAKRFVVAASYVNAIVIGGDVKITVVDDHIDGFNPLERLRDGKVAAIDGDGVIGVNTVVGGC